MIHITVKDLKEKLNEFDNSDIVTIFAKNCPPWINEFSFRISPPEEDDTDE